MNTFPKPMLGVTVDLEKLTFPLYTSPKLDGVRAIIKDGVVYSRNGKPIPNKATQEIFKNYHGLDGELIVGCPIAPNVFQQTTSGVMSVEGTPNVRLYAFDCWYAEGGINKRYDELLKIIAPWKKDTEGRLPILDIDIIEQTTVNNIDELLEFEEKCLNLGYEGVILRNLDAKYKHGRSTVKEGALLKLKRFSDSEAVILGMEPLMRNNNPAMINALGYTERSTHKDNKVADEILGILLVKDIHTGVEFSIGSGFDSATRRSLWAMRDKLKGLLVKYKYFTVGVKDKPRFPIFLGIRDKGDM